MGDDYTIEDLYLALRESVKLQSHYASLLNTYDGGHRVGFSSPEAWINRLKEIGTLKQDSKKRDDDGVSQHSPNPSPNSEELKGNHD